MKQIRLTLLFTLIFTINSFGQNYQTVNSKQIAYFDNQFNNIKCLRIDSVKYQSDSILFPFTVIQQLDYDCYSPYIASWIGKAVTICNDGTNILINKMGDSITIKTQSILGEKWIAYQIQDSLIIEATVLDFDVLSFLGINDSVKTIGFQTYDKNMNPLDYELNEMKLQISKNYGFVKTFNFYLFPNFKVDYPSEKLEEYNLIGLSTPNVGVSNLTWLDVNDFQVGDELHVLDEYSCWYGDGDGSATTIKAIYKYLERTDYSNSIVYRYSRKQSNYNRWTDSSSYTYYDDVLNITIKPDSLFNKLPDEPIITNNDISKYNMINTSPLTKIYDNAQFMSAEDSCWQVALADGCLKSNKYIKGLGGPYYYCRQSFCLGGAERKLVYYKKGEVTWGNPLIITSTSDSRAVPNINIYPNPAQDILNINLPKNSFSDYSFFIYDIQGRLIKHNKLENNNTKIDIGDIRTGIYLLQISTRSEVLKMEKLIVE